MEPKFGCVLFFHTYSYPFMLGSAMYKIHLALSPGHSPPKSACYKSNLYNHIWIKSLQSHLNQIFAITSESNLCNHIWIKSLQSHLNQIIAITSESNLCNHIWINLCNHIWIKPLQSHLNQTLNCNHVWIKPLQSHLYKTFAITSEALLEGIEEHIILKLIHYEIVQQTLQTKFESITYERPF